jgi:hypothetical protein
MKALRWKLIDKTKSKNMLIAIEVKKNKIPQDW